MPLRQKALVSGDESEAVISSRSRVILFSNTTVTTSLHSPSPLPLSPFAFSRTLSFVPFFPPRLSPQTHPPFRSPSPLSPFVFPYFLLPFTSYPPTSWHLALLPPHSRLFLASGDGGRRGSLEPGKHRSVPHLVPCPPPSAGHEHYHSPQHWTVPYPQPRPSCRLVP